ncbi:uncharacterized protein TNCV_2954081 [Trichonephila clavipes]|nr:uncharacterized protein TNCV_2954081 [Trichonephila clavipes]
MEIKKCTFKLDSVAIGVSSRPKLTGIEREKAFLHVLRRRPIKVYFAYFGIKLGDQDKLWAPQVVCSVCVEELRQWFQVQGFNLKNRKDISYPTIIRSAIRPVPHGPNLPIPSPPDTLDNILDDLDQISHISDQSSRQ